MERSDQRPWGSEARNPGWVEALASRRAFHVEHRREGLCRMNVVASLLLFHVKHLVYRDNFLLHSSRTSGDFLVARVIAITNQKGGVGKTTTAVNLGASLAASEQRTLIIDCDPQGNTTSALGFPKDPARRTLYQSIILDEPIERVTLDGQVEDLHLIPPDKNLVAASADLVPLQTHETKLKADLHPPLPHYPSSLLSCPPLPLPL